MNILIIGAGYVGLVTASCMAEMGHHVICLDIDKEKIASLQKGIIPIYEPGLEDLVLRGIKAKRLEFTHLYEEAVSQTSICFLAVATPEAQDGSCNTDYILSAARSVGNYIDKEYLIAIKSTVPVGTADTVKTILLATLKERGVNYEIEVVSNPEFLKEGAAVADCMKPDRIIIGANTAKAIETMHILYQPFMMSRDRMITMSVRSAELTKYAANAMLATRISFMNELSLLCEQTGAQINEIRQGIGSDSRIGYQFLYAGVGYGGSCFPKDLRALQAMAKNHNVPSLLIDAVETINERQKKRIAEKMELYFAPMGGLQNKTIAIWGLAFKPNTDDLREAPALELISYLLNQGAFVRLFDPIAMDKAKQLLSKHPRLSFCDTEYSAAEKADAIALITEWQQFRSVDLNRIRISMQGKGFFDGRNQYHTSSMRGKDFDYMAIGIT